MLKENYSDLILYLHLTLDCNMRCKYCYGGEKTNESMTFDIGRKALDFVLSRTKKLSLRFFGGEPLLKFDLLKELTKYAVEHAQSTKIDYALVTNGTLFSEEVAKFCASYKIGCSLSLDGNQQSHDTNRIFPCGRGSFAEVEKNFSHMLKYNPYAQVVAVVSPNNVHLLSESVEYLLERGFRNIAFSPDFPGFSQITNRSANNDFEELLDILKQQYYQIADIYLKYRKKGQWLFINPFESSGAEYDLGQKCKLGAIFSVAPCGDIYPCCCFVDHKKYLLGNVEQGIDTEKAAIFMQELQRLDDHIEKAHQDCPENSCCRRRCACTNIVTSGKMSVVDPVICAYGRIESTVREYVYRQLNQDAS